MSFPRKKGEGGRPGTPPSTAGLMPYHGGGDKMAFAPWVYALHDVVKRRDRTLRLVSTVWPAHKGLPSEAILLSWMRDVEEGKVKVQPKLRQWVKDALEVEEQQAMREAVLDATLTFSQFTKEMREKRTLPPGGVVALKYLADAAGFLTGKRQEALTATRSGKQQTLQANKFILNLGERPAPKVRAPQVRVIDGEARQLPPPGAHDD